MWRDLSMIWMSRGLHQRRPICRKVAGVAPSRYQCLDFTLLLNGVCRQRGAAISCCSVPRSCHGQFNTHDLLHHDQS